MEKTLYKSLIKYYSHLKTVNNIWNETFKSVKEIINGLKNRSEQLRLVTSAEADKTEIYKQEGLKEKLILKIFRGIQEEITLLGNLLIRLSSINQELKNKLMLVEEARSNVSLRDSEMRELINGTPLVPRLDKLLLWAKDTYDFYQSLFRNINECMNSLDYTNVETFERLEKSFHINYFWRMKIGRILGLTETLSRTNVSQV